MNPHGSWLDRLVVKAKADQKTFRIVNLASGKEAVDAIDISVIENQSTQSSSDKTGWMVDVRYQNAPESILFTQTYPTEEQARKVMEDLSKVAAEVEGLIKSEKFDEAKEATQDFMKKMTANTGQPPVEENTETESVA